MQGDYVHSNGNRMQQWNLPLARQHVVVESVLLVVVVTVGWWCLARAGLLGLVHTALTTNTS